MTAYIVASVVQVFEWSYSCNFDRVCSRFKSKRLCTQGGSGCRIWCNFTKLELDPKKSIVDSRYFRRQLNQERLQKCMPKSTKQKLNFSLNLFEEPSEQ